MNVTRYSIFGFLMMGFSIAFYRNLQEALADYRDWP